MNTSKAIDISKSSLISLKAELSRKQDEVQKAKSNKFTSDPKHHGLRSKRNVFEKRKHKKEENVDESVLNEDVNDEENEALKKSREVLEVKSKLYDHLQEGVLTTDHGKSEYLVNFDQKNIDKQKDDSDAKDKDVDKSDKIADVDPYSDEDEDDWVDFTDTLGRSKRCLRKDLKFMKQRDSELIKLLKPPTPPPQLSDEKDAVPGSISQEMLSNDMHREMMRRKWEEQEQKLLQKTDLHYQDLLFDEARTHGVGYYNFSTDEDERAKQQRELLRLRQDTLKRQEEAQGLRNRRNQQLQARLKAARLRNRQRLGLPPEDEEKSECQSDVIITGETKGEEPDETNLKKLEDLEKSLKRAAHIRPWDEGKDGVKIQVMSQEEWVEKKREDRISEFAPPATFIEDTTSEINISSKRGQSGLFFTSKKLRTATTVQPSSSSVGQRNETIKNENFSKIKNELSDDSGEDVAEDLINKRRDKHHKRAEIPPPSTMEYYGGTSHKPTKEKTKIGSSKDVEDSISEGLKYLQKQNEIKEQKREKGLLDFI